MNTKVALKQSWRVYKSTLKPTTFGFLIGFLTSFLTLPNPNIFFIFFSAIAYLSIQAICFVVPFVYYRLENGRRLNVYDT
jgi:hypothetical protein